MDKLRVINKRYIYIYAMAMDEWNNQNRVIQLANQDYSTSSLLTGVILQKPETDDEQTNESLPPGTKVIVKAYDDQGRIFVEPLGGQSLMEKGRYVALSFSVLAIMEEENTDE